MGCCPRAITNRVPNTAQDLQGLATAPVTNQQKLKAACWRQRKRRHTWEGRAHRLGSRMAATPCSLCGMVWAHYSTSGRKACFTLSRAAPPPASPWKTSSGPPLRPCLTHLTAFSLLSGLGAPQRQSLASLLCPSG